MSDASDEEAITLPAAVAEGWFDYPRWAGEWRCESDRGDGDGVFEFVGDYPDGITFADGTPASKFAADGHRWYPVGPRPAETLVRHEEPRVESHFNLRRAAEGGWSWLSISARDLQALLADCAALAAELATAIEANDELRAELAQLDAGRPAAALSRDDIVDRIGGQLNEAFVSGYRLGEMAAELSGKAVGP